VSWSIDSRKFKNTKSKTLLSCIWNYFSPGIYLKYLFSRTVLIVISGILASFCNWHSFTIFSASYLSTLLITVYPIFPCWYESYLCLFFVGYSYFPIDYDSYLCPPSCQLFLFLIGYEPYLCKLFIWFLQQRYQRWHGIIVCRILITFLEKITFWFTVCFSIFHKKSCIALTCWGWIYMTTVSVHWCLKQSRIPKRCSLF